VQEVRHDPLEIAALARRLLPAVVERARLGKPRADATSDIIVEHHHVDAFDLLATKAGRELDTCALAKGVDANWARFTRSPTHDQPDEHHRWDLAGLPVLLAPVPHEG
jgi:hypothetical protein